MKRALAATLLCAAVVTAAGCGSGAELVSSRPHVSAAARPGPELAGEVQVVAYASHDVRICTNLNDGLVYSVGPPQPPGCENGLPVVGVHVRALTSRAPGKPTRWGLLYLVGRYANGRFDVTSQRHWAPDVRGHDPFARPPCATPRGGWLLERSHLELRTVNMYRRLTGHRDITSLAYFDNGSILTLSSTHPARTRAVVGQYGPRQLCVVRSRYAPKVIHAVRQRMVGLLRFASSPQWGWPQGGGGQGDSPAGQPTTSLEVVVVTPKLRAYLNRQPHGIVVVDAALHPLGRG